MNKQCTRCKEWKDIGEFPKANARFYLCRTCYLEWKRGRYYECRYPITEETPDAPETIRRVTLWYAAEGRELTGYVKWCLDSMVPLSYTLGGNN